MIPEIKMDKVVIKKCAEYNAGLIAEKIEESLELLGGIDKFVKRGETVLLKVNALMPAVPEKAVTTHPEFLRAVIRVMRRNASKIYVADSPGVGSFRAGAKVNGCLKVIEEEGAELSELKEEEEITNSRALNYKTFKTSVLIKKVDRIINLPKFKTHGLMYMTLCVKNMFGIIPGPVKAGYHMRAGRDRELFARILIDVYNARPPDLNIVDGITAMEGNGPGSGDPFDLGVILTGADGFSVDFIAPKIVGMAPEKAFTNMVYKRDVLKGKNPEIEVLGDSIETALRKDFRPVDRLGSFIPGFLKGIGKNLLTPKQVFIKETCTGCLRCVKACPVDALNYDERKKIGCDYDKCIRCFICQEICPEKAIEIRENFIMKLFK
ncbi:MAG TPA: DUF362 domain-containing protein [bacterium]|nr:DUF362 domain-containing protein [bacterium]